MLRPLWPACLIASVLLSLVVLPRALRAEQPLVRFHKQQLHDQFWSEGATFGDLNNDGHPDVIAGPWWWEGPKFETRHEYAPATTTFTLKLGPQTNVQVPGFEGTLGRNNTYSNNFFAFVHDFNGDRFNDILIIGFPGKETCWYQNPGSQPAPSGSHWTRHVAFDQTDNESPTFADLTGDGKPELVCITKGAYGYASPNSGDPTAKWVFHPISPRKGYGNFTHGMGLGDVDGDGKTDLLEKDGWWKQPESLAEDPEWRHFPAPFGGGGAQMHVYDVNGDGRADVITSLAAHAFGLAWFEQRGDAGQPQWERHLLVGDKPADSPYGVKFSELHAIDLLDVDGDGLKDIVTGKRFWSHGRTGDPDRNDSAVLYWFQLQRSAAGEVDFVPWLIDADSGVGTQVVAGDLNRDGLPDVVIGNKKGAFVFRQSRDQVADEEFLKARPVKTTPK
ncbi:MAG: FG-GAP repeat domain-containing protein [Planctomycetaceae bacterium]